MKRTFKKRYVSLDDGQVHTYALIDQLREQAPITLVCCAFEVPASCFYDYLARERIPQLSELRRLFKESRGSAGSRALMSMMRELGYQIGLITVRGLMKAAGLVLDWPLDDPDTSPLLTSEVVLEPCSVLVATRRRSKC